MQSPVWFIIDFDSTFTQVEAMEELALISLEKDPEKEILIEKIKQLTDLAMDGKMPFGKSLKARIALLSARKYHIQLLVNRLRKRVSASFARNKGFFKEYKGRIIIISGGFKEFIEPVVKPYFIDPENIYANTFTYDKKNNIIGADEENVLAQESGKVKLLKQLKLPGKVIMIGDGYTDLQVFEAGLASRFYAFTENVVRDSVVSRSQWIAPSLDEILYHQKLPMALSYPKSRIRAMLWGNDTFVAEKALRAEGYQVVKVKDSATRAEVSKELDRANLLICSPFLNTSWLAQKTSKLLALGIWGDQQTPHFESMADSGVPVFSASFAHSRSISELAIQFMLVLSRALNEELAGKRLGILGYGHSGSQLSVLADHLGLEVYYFDIENRPPLGNARKTKSIQELLRKSQILVVTAGKRFSEGELIGQRELKLLPGKALVINLSYEYTVNLAGIKEALMSGRLGGFGIDTIDESYNKQLPKGENCLITHRARLNTRQVQQNISETICERIIGFVNTGNTNGSINFPAINLQSVQDAHRFIHIHKNKPGVLADINGILSKHRINIISQQLKTDEKTGYVITDVKRKYPDDVIDELKSVSGTIRFRVLY